MYKVNVDMNIAYTNYPEVIKQRGLNGSLTQPQRRSQAKARGLIPLKKAILCGISQKNI